MRKPGENAGGRVPARRRSPSGRAASPHRGQVPGSAVPGSGPGGIGPGEAGPGGQVTRQPSIFTPGYSGGRSARRDPRSGGAQADAGQYAAGHYGGPPHEAGQYGSGPYVAGQYGSAGSATGKGPIRGFPPAPGQPPPLYPPGPFSAWNRAPWPGENGYGDPGAVGPDIVGPDTGAWLAPDSEAPGSAGPGEPESGPAYPGPGYADDGYSPAGYADQDYSALAVSDPAADVTSTQAWGVVDDAGTGWPGMNSRNEPGRYAGRVPPGADYDVDQAMPWQAAPGDEPYGWAAPGQAAPGEFGSAEAGEPAPRWDGPRRAQPDDERDGLGTRQARRASGGAGTGTRLTQETTRRPGTRGHGSRGRARPRERRGPGRVLLAVGQSLGPHHVPDIRPGAAHPHRAVPGPVLRRGHQLRPDRAESPDALRRGPDRQRAGVGRDPCGLHPSHAGQLSVLQQADGHDRRAESQHVQRREEGREGRGHGRLHRAAAGRQGPDEEADQGDRGRGRRGEGPLPRAGLGGVRGPARPEVARAAAPARGVHQRPDPEDREREPRRPHGHGPPGHLREPPRLAQSGPCSEQPWSPGQAAGSGRRRP